MVKRIITALIGLLLLIIIVRTLLPSEKRRFKKDIMELKGAVEQERYDTALKYIDQSYNDESGLTYEEIVNKIDRLFSSFDSIKVIISGLKLSIDSIGQDKTFYASCSLGLKVFARYQGDKILLFGGIIKPAPVRAWFKKVHTCYKVYNAQY